MTTRPRAVLRTAVENKEDVSQGCVPCHSEEEQRTLELAEQQGSEPDLPLLTD